MSIKLLFSHRINCKIIISRREPNTHTHINLTKLFARVFPHQSSGDNNRARSSGPAGNRRLSRRPNVEPATSYSYIIVFVNKSSENVEGRSGSPTGNTGHWLASQVLIFPYFLYHIRLSLFLRFSYKSIPCLCNISKRRFVEAIRALFCVRENAVAVITVMCLHF